MAAKATLGIWIIKYLMLLSCLNSLGFTYSTRGLSTIIKRLAPLLSPNASIVYPGSAEFDVAIERFNTYFAPNFTVAVEVATEKDIQEVVRFANHYNIPFSAKTGGHSTTKSLATLQHGIEIWMRKLNSVTIAPDGRTATIGGGVIAKEVTDALWAANKQTTTGVCECVSMVGPLLGGGHGILEGRYGLIADNLVSARLILWDGTTITVSKTSYPDLFWALRGAGHNFGIVSEFTNEIYDVPVDDSWAYETYVFSHEKVEELFALPNLWTENGTKSVPDGFFTYLNFMRLPIDLENAVVSVGIYYEGSPTVPGIYSDPLRAIGPLTIQSGTATYPELAAINGQGIDGPVCGHGATNMMFPVALTVFNVTAQRGAFDEFNSFTSIQPAFNHTVFLFEVYSVRSVRSVQADTTAYPFRGDIFLTSSLLNYMPNEALDAEAEEHGSRLRNIIYEGSGSPELHTYVNYAHGDEPLQAVYGYEPWRLERLRHLKKKYDPKGRFSFFEPF